MSIESSNPILNIGELAKPATVLIEKVSDAVGCLYEPTKIKRLARAESEAARIISESHIQITDLERRAAQRWLKEEAIHQRNMEGITAKSISLLKADANPDTMENDWIANFFAKSRVVSDKDMQHLWARILAGEANVPGTFSRRTVNVLSDLDKGVAEKFSRLCGFSWTVAQNFEPLLFQLNGEIYIRHGIDFKALSNLEAIGLVQLQSIGLKMRVNSPSCIADYFGRPLVLELPKEGENSFDIGHTSFTSSGKELSRICGSRPVDGFYEYVKEQWKQYLPEVNKS